MLARAILVLQEIVRLKQEEADCKLALSLQEEQSTIAPPTATNPFSSTLDAGRTYSAPQVSLDICSTPMQCIAQILLCCLHTSDLHLCISDLWVIRTACGQLDNGFVGQCWTMVLFLIHAPACICIIQPKICLFHPRLVIGWSARIPE